MLDDAALLHISRDWVEARTRSRDLVVETLGPLVGFDDVVWMHTDFERGAFSSWRASSGGTDSAVNAIAPRLLHHPAILSYLLEPGNLSPRRLSDVSAPSARSVSDSARRQSERVIGRHQLSLVVDLAPPFRGRGWIVTRQSRDFDEDDLATARQLLPLLVLHERHLDALDSESTRSTRHADGLLTAREDQIANLLRTGMTAGAIGRLLGISPRTVSKHLEHIYAKLGTHDRLLVSHR